MEMEKKKKSCQQKIYKYGFFFPIIFKFFTVFLVLCKMAGQ